MFVGVRRASPSDHFALIDKRVIGQPGCPRLLNLSLETSCMSPHLIVPAKTKALVCLILCGALLGCSTTPSSEPGESDDSAGADEDGNDEADDEGDDDEPVDGPNEPVNRRRDAGSTGSSTPQKDAAVPAEDKTGAPDAGAPTAAGDLNWCKVKPILEKHCTSCHEQDGVAPMPLLSAKDFQANAPKTAGKKVYEVSKTRINDTAKPMPPPPKKLTADELSTLNAWLDAKAPAGTESCDAPSADASGRVDGWNEEECDAIYEVRAHGPGGKDDPYVVPPGQEIHPQIRVDAPWGNEKVQAIAFRPITDNKKVLHHWILNGFGRTFLVGWAPGDEGRPPFPKDVGMDMPTGAGAFVLDMHYYNTQTGAKSEPDRSGLQICVLKAPNFRPKLAAVAGGLASVGSGGILAPRMTKDKPTTGTCNVTAREPVHLMTANPHAHKYAVRMEFKVKKKNGMEIVMHDEPWVFGEQGTYALPGGEVIVETGDVITTTCYYTNMTSRDIRFGESTESEMCFNFALYYPKGAFSCGGSGGLGGLGGFGGQ